MWFSSLWCVIYVGKLTKLQKIVINLLLRSVKLFFQMRRFLIVRGCKLCKKPTLIDKNLNLWPLNSGPNLHLDLNPLKLLKKRSRKKVLILFLAHFHSLSFGSAWFTFEKKKTEKEIYFTQKRDWLYQKITKSVSNLKKSRKKTGEH